jgi:branched-chain amino acid aminotransferase
MINFNGIVVDSESNLLKNNRAFLFGDAVFETMKIVDNKILFLEDHYFRLMASMRIIRMEIPMNFTMEFFQEEILNLALANSCENSGRVRFTVFRNDGGYYLPQTNQVSYLIDVNPLENSLYQIEKNKYEVELFKDSYISKQLISTIKSTNKLINITGSIFASENGFDTCLLLNDSKNVVEALQGNLFMLMGNKLITPPISEGCLNGVMRKQIIEIAKKIENIEVIEEPISPFDLQKADELFITNVIKGIQPITQYRRKTFGTNLSNQLLNKLNIAIRLC